jgi:hypothetical protein
MITVYIVRAIDDCADMFWSKRTYAARLQWWFVNPIIMMVWLGTAYAAGASALWPMVSFILPHHVLGTAYGTMTAIQNLGVWHCCDQWYWPGTVFDAECEVRAFLPSASSCSFSGWAPAVDRLQSGSTRLA